MLRSLSFLLALCIPALSRAQPIACDGGYPSHLQGICADQKDALFWCWTDALVKTDLNGKILAKVAVANHHGDLCYHEGRVYVAVNLGKFNRPAGEADSWVYVYDAATLEELARHPVPELVHGAGGMAYHDGKFVVVGGLPPDVPENYLYEYDTNFKFIQRRVLASGYTLMGIQTAAWANGAWWFGCYGKPTVLLRADENFQFNGRWEFNASVGIEQGPDGTFLIGANRKVKDVGHQGSIVTARADETRGLVAEAAAVAERAPLTVAADFEGGSVRAVEIDQAARQISFMPGGDPVRGWPCWWYFRVDGLAAEETLTLKLRGSTATVPAPGSPLSKPLSPVWAMPGQATFSDDGGKTWRHTEKGTRQDEWMIYTLKPGAASVLVAWGPPYTPSTAAAFVREAAGKAPQFAKAEELCRSREGREVPMLHVQEGDRPAAQRFGVWIQARQHAWESGSSWVAQGFAEWLLSEDPEAAWLRQHAEIFVVPIMDIDNTARGNGGKDAQPQDHNRDWTPNPHWNEVAAAQKRVSGLIAEQRMDVFVDLHNPAPGDPTFFYILPSEMLQEPMIGLRDRFIELAYGRISRIKPLIPMSNKPKVTGASYHPLWRQISANWVSMNGNPHTVSLCLETIWNYQNSTTDGYRAVGANLAAGVREYLAERPAR